VTTTIRARHIMLGQANKELRNERERLRTRGKLNCVQNFAAIKSLGPGNRRNTGS